MSDLYISPEEVIAMAIGSNSGMITRRKEKVKSQQTRGLINKGLVDLDQGHSPLTNGVGQEDSNNPYGLDAELWQKIEAINRMSPFGPETVKVKSGRRSYEEQARLYEGYRKGLPGYNLAAKPGTSKHETGRAADLDYLNDEAKKWVHSVARDLGLHFPVRGEDWHVERIG